MLILTHHRLPEGETDYIGVRGGAHARPMPEGGRDSLRITSGTPFWHEEWWLRRLAKDAAMILPGTAVEGIDIALRGALVFADHLGSSESEKSETRPAFLANTKKGEDGTIHPADSLSTHVRRVYLNCRPAFDMLHRLRDRMPALSEAQMPVDLIRPEIENPRFSSR